MVTPNALADHPALDLSNDIGTIERLHDDGSVHSDNPFGLTRAIAHTERLELRLPPTIQGLAVDPLTGDVWSNEHRPAGRGRAQPDRGRSQLRLDGGLPRHQL